MVSWLKGLAKTTKNLNKYSRSPRRDLKTGPLLYVAGVIKQRLRGIR